MQCFHRRFSPVSSSYDYLIKVMNNINKTSYFIYQIAWENHKVNIVMSIVGHFKNIHSSSSHIRVCESSNWMEAGHERLQNSLLSVQEDAPISSVPPPLLDWIFIQNTILSLKRRKYILNNTDLELKRSLLYMRCLCI